MHMSLAWRRARTGFLRRSRATRAEKDPAIVSRAVAKPDHRRVDVVIPVYNAPELVRRCIDRLPEGYRTVLLLRDIEGLDTETTAEQLDLSVGAVKTRLHRARQALRTLLDPHLREAVT